VQPLALATEELGGPRNLVLLPTWRGYVVARRSVDGAGRALL